MKQASLLAIAAFLALMTWSAPAQATFPGENGKIAYTSKVPYRDEEGFPTDNPGDIHVVNPDGSDDTNLTPANPNADGSATWSPDGTRLAFASRATPAAPTLIWVMNADGSGKSQVTSGGSPAYHDADPAWTADAQRIAFVRNPADGSCSTIYTVRPDGTDLVPLSPAPECRVAHLDFSPDATRLAYFGSTDSKDTHGLYVATAANGGPTKILTDGSAPDWAPGADWLAYSWTSLNRTTPDGLHRYTISSGGGAAAWSPDGTLIATSGVRIRDDAGNFVRDVGECVTCGNPQIDPDWQPLPSLPPVPGHARPKAATPLIVSLVPAYEPCVGPRRPNLTHGPPFAHGSCGPPNRESQFLTVGTADSNGEATQSMGSIKFKQVFGDVEVMGRITDVRCVAGGAACAGGALSDYTGGLRVSFRHIEFGTTDPALTITDQYNGGTGREAATASFAEFELPFTVPISCAPTASTTSGSTCAVSTTFNSILPGVVAAGKRANWQLGAVRVEDGGADGDPATDGNTTFASQGLFVP